MSTVMVVDDAQFMRRRVAKSLAERGYQVIEAQNGEEAVQTYRSNQPDAVLMDITMPGKDGLAALSEIRQYDPQAKVIMLTALGQHAILLQAMKAGANGFVVKPYEADRLIKAVQNALV